MLGYDEDEIGTSPDEWLTRVHHDDAARVESGAARAPGRRQRPLRERAPACCTATARSAGCSAAARRSETPTGAATRLAGSLTDITDAKVADALTGLPNRLLFVDLLERAIKRAHAAPGYAFALLVLGLDRFKDGQRQPRAADGRSPAGRGGAAAAVEPARHRRRHARRHRRARWRGSAATSSRCCSTTSPMRATRCASPSGCARALEKPFDVDGQQVFTSATVGIAVSTDGIRAAGGDPARRRDRAPPRQGRSAPRGASSSIRRCATARSRGCRSRPTCGSAIDERGVRGRTTSRSSRSRPAASPAFEALVRWRHPVRGTGRARSSSSRVAEDTGMILPIGRLALAESCRQMAAWQRTLRRRRAGRDLRQRVEPAVRRRRSRRRRSKRCCATTGLEASNLKLEITESAFIGDVDAARATRQPRCARSASSGASTISAPATRR